MSASAEPAKIAPDDWDGHWTEYSDANERNPAQDYRRLLCMFLVGRQGPPDRLLDIGSGNGELLAAAADRWPAARLSGLELSPVGVEETKRKLPGVHVRVCDLMTSPEPTGGEAGWASHAVCSEVLEHVDDPVKLLRNVRSWLEPGCRLVVTVPGGPMSAFDRHIGHRRHFSPDDLGGVLVDAGFEPQLLAGAGFPFFNLYRGLVIARGERLVSDVTADSLDTPQAKVIGVAMLAFKPLLVISLPRSPLGWQTVGVAHLPVA